MGNQRAKPHLNVSQKTHEAIERMSRSQREGVPAGRQRFIQRENPELLRDLLGEMEAYVANNGFFSRLWRAIASFSTAPLFDSNIDRVEAILERFQGSETPWKASHIMRHLTAHVLTYRGVYSELLGREEHINQRHDSAMRPPSQYQTISARWNEEGRAFLKRLWDRLLLVPTTESPSMRPASYPAYRHPGSPLLHLAIGYDQGEEVIRALIRQHINTGTREDVKVLAQALRHHAYGNPMSVRYQNGPYSQVEEDVIYRHPLVIDWMLEEITDMAPLQKMQMLHLLYGEIQRNSPLQSDLIERARRVCGIYDEARSLVSETVETLNVEEMVFLVGAQRERGENLNTNETEHLITLLNAENSPSKKLLRALFSSWQYTPETLSRIPTSCFAFLGRLSKLYSAHSEPERTVFKALPAPKKLEVITAFLLPERDSRGSCSTDSTVKILFDRIRLLNPAFTTTKDIVSLILADSSLHETLLTQETLDTPASLACFIKHNMDKTMKRESLNRVCAYLKQEHVANDPEYQEVYVLLTSLKDDKGKPCNQRLTATGQFFASQHARASSSHNVRPGGQTHHAGTGGEQPLHSEKQPKPGLTSPGMDA